MCRFSKNIAEFLLIASHLDSCYIKITDIIQIYSPIFELHQGAVMNKIAAKIPFKFLPRAWKNDKVYFAEEDEEGYQLIMRYKATWKF
jgi:hypothetical protein